MLETFVLAAFALITLFSAGLMVRRRGRPDQFPDQGTSIYAGQLAPEPVLHEVPRDIAEFIIPDFRPGIDRCHVALNDPDAEFDAVLDVDGVRFQFLDGGSFLEVVFPGLIDPPFEDTRIFGPGPAAHGTALSDLVAPGAGPPDPNRFHRVRSEIAAFQSFHADRVVEVWVPPGVEVLPQIDVRPSLDGADSEVVIDGRPAARLCGAPNADGANIRIVRKEPRELEPNRQMIA